jgi:hypothetical protein
MYPYLTSLSAVTEALLVRFSPLSRVPDTNQWHKQSSGIFCLVLLVK